MTSLIVISDAGRQGEAPLRRDGLDNSSLGKRLEYLGQEPGRDSFALAIADSMLTFPSFCCARYRTHECRIHHPASAS